MECKSWLYWPSMLLMMIHFLMVGQTQGYCIEEERKALIQIKASYLKSFDDTSVEGFLPTWVDHDNGSSTPGNGGDDCCDWERVNCNTTTRHVTQLSLYRLRGVDDFWDDHNLWQLNVSVFFHFKELTSLNLSDNAVDKGFMKTGTEGLSSLKKLEVLDLSWNSDINNDILPSLRTLTSLKILDLSGTSLNGNFPITDFLNCSNLEVLLLKDNRFNGTIPMEAFASFHRLEVLDLSYNNLVGSIPSSIQSLSSLRALSFANNDLSGSLSDHGFCESKNLVELDLSGNMVDGFLPKCWNKLSSLKLLDISLNRFTGKLMPSVIADLTSLEYIDVSHNMFEGSFSFSSFSNHTNLELVRFRSDNDKFKVETEEPIGWIPKFQLQVLELSNCNMKMPKGSGRVLPGFLIHQHMLREVDMTDNSLEGHFPNWLIKNNTNLEVLFLRNNLFGGMSLYSNANMKVLDMSENHIRGNFPDNIPNLFPNMRHLNLSMNALSGVIPFTIGGMSELWTLDISDNELSGEVPQELFTNVSEIRVLRLSNNKLHGEVLSGNLRWVNLGWVYLDGNYFTGKIGMGISQEISEYLSVLDISNNLFTGVIPSWISNMRSLHELVVRNNRFEGRFPCGVAPFSYLDISQNSFSGPIPSCSNFQYIEHLLLGSNKFTGSIPKSFRNLTQVLTLDMGNNNLSGTIPTFLGELSSVRILLLRKNNFSGSIPKQLCQLSDVIFIDLAGNSLSGSVPSCVHINGQTDLAFSKGIIEQYSLDSSYNYRGILRGSGSIYHYSEVFSYTGDILNYMAGMDFSCNKLTGQIPQELGLSIQLRALNLSHNQLTGPIPVSFSNLTKIESLDLSSNGLTGKIPSELIKLNSLSTFNVSYNNLSGRLPPFTAQFGTFTEASYEGNPLLCGPPLEKKCTPNSQVINLN